MMPSRIALLIIDGMILTFIVTILSFGHDFRKGPMKNGCRKYIIYFAYHVCCSFYLMICGMTTTAKKEDFDYTYYLGPNYKDNMSYLKQTSTIICNHISWLDPVVLIKLIRPAFAPSSEF